MGVRLVSTSGSTAVLQVPLTDYTRLITIQDG